MRMPQVKYSTMRTRTTVQHVSTTAAMSPSTAKASTIPYIARIALLMDV